MVFLQNTYQNLNNGYTNESTNVKEDCSNDINTNEVVQCSYIILEQTKKESPLDRNTLGRSTWSLLRHHRSSYYPEKPTKKNKTKPQTFSRTFRTFIHVVFVKKISKKIFKNIHRN